MAYKERQEPANLTLMHSLKSRMRFTNKDENNYANGTRGFEGECRLDQLTEQLSCDCRVLNDLLLKVNDQLFQIDTLVITAEALIIYEAKNFKGEFIYQDERLYKGSLEYEVSNPHVQLQRTQALFRQLLRKLGFKAPVKGYVAFINDECTIYNVQMHSPFLLPTALKKHFEKLDKNPHFLTEDYKQLADQLCQLHIESSPYSNLPEFEYRKLRKGVLCFNCHQFVEQVVGWSCVCSQCGHKEKATQAILRHAKEYRGLFPSRKMTSSAIEKWCGYLFSSYQIRYALKKHYQTKSTGRWMYFV